MDRTVQYCSRESERQVRHDHTHLFSRLPSSNDGLGGERAGLLRQQHGPGGPGAIRSVAANAAKIDFCSKGSKPHCSSCTWSPGHEEDIWKVPVTVGIGSDVGFLLFAENWVAKVRTEGLYPNATGANQTAGWPRNYILPEVSKTRTRD